MKLLDTTLITQPRAGTSHNEIIALQMSAESKGWKVIQAPSGWRLDDELVLSASKGVAYGSQTFCEVIAMQMKWQLKQNSFDWLAKLPERFVKRNIQFMTMAEAKKLTEKKFIKPADDKVFAAAVYEPGTFNPHASIPDDTPTLVSDVVQWDIEYRCFVAGTTCYTWSNYLFHGEINDPRYHHMINTDYPHPAEFVQEVLKHTNTHVDRSGNPIFMMNETSGTVPSVVDVGIIHGKGMAVIETNQAWASGIYGCDPDRVLDVLEMSVTI